MANVGVIGAGSWGTALSVLLADNGHHVTIWSIDEKEVEMLDKKREHLTKLPGVKLSDGMTITGDLESAVKGKDFLVFAVPSPFTRATAKKMSAYVGKGQIIVDVAKGIEEKSLMTLSQIIEEELPEAELFFQDQAMQKKSEESFRQHVSSEQKQKKRRNICSLRLLIKCSVYIQVRIF